MSKLIRIADAVEVQIRDLFLKPVHDELESLAEGTRVFVFFEGDESEFPPFLLRLIQKKIEVHPVLVLSKKIKWRQFRRQAPFWIWEGLFIVPRAFRIEDPHSLTCAQVHRWVRRMARQGIRARILPHRDYETGFRSSQPAVQKRWESVVSSHPRVSVIIPMRDSSDFVLKVIHHILQQSEDPRNYELILVDDGSDETLFQQVAGLIGPLKGKFNIRFLSCPRPPAAASDLFRAGFCRNVGVEQARATDWFLFLDADILLPKNFLMNLLENREADVIQAPRWHLSPERSSLPVVIEDIPRQDLSIEEPKYWKPFFDCSDWMSLPDFWRYTCTYCLAVRVDQLRAVGGFREVFQSYGFEDTELGYRLAKAQAVFRLGSEPVVHLTPPRARSRYRHSILLKQLLLSKTGKIFFLSTLDPHVYRLFWTYMGGEPWWRQLSRTWWAKIFSNAT